jgi:tetratricopeptide (TPR) repeat protein
VAEQDKPPHLLSDLQEARAQADALLEAHSVSHATVDRWEQTAEEYRGQQLHMPLDLFLTRRLQDFRQLQAILSRPQPLMFQTRLYRVMAQLAGQIGFTLMGLGALRESLGWSHTAHLAADEIGDRLLLVWLTAWEAMPYFWDTRLTERAIALCETAQLMAGSPPTAAAAFAASVQARAYARLSRRREALDAMNKAEAMFGCLELADGGPIPQFAFDEQRLWYDRQNTLTRLGETKAAMEAQEYALSLTSSETNTVEPAMIQLDRASCLITINEVDEGCALACRALSGTTKRAVGGVMGLRAREIDGMCQSRGIHIESARNFHQMVTQAAGRG